MIVIIPARYDSTRLPGKTLLPIHGKPMIQHVYECATASSANRIVIATDNDKVGLAAREFGAEVCMTSDQHRSGTERLAEVVEKLGIDPDEIIVNLQGDEPLMPASLIDQVAATLEESDAQMATACHEIEQAQEVLDPNVVKVVVDKGGYALYFSRASIPYPRDNPGLQPYPANTFYRHIGLYAYRAGFLATYTSWSPSPLEQHEMLEQLRVLWHGQKIAVCIAEEVPGPGIDTQADLETASRLIRPGGN